MTSQAKDGVEWRGETSLHANADRVFNFILNARARPPLWRRARQPRFVCRYQDYLGMGRERERERGSARAVGRPTACSSEITESGDRLRPPYHSATCLATACSGFDYEGRFW